MEQIQYIVYNYNIEQQYVVAYYILQRFSSASINIIIPPF